MHSRRFLLIVACNAPFITGCFGSPDKGEPNTDPACQINSPAEKTPGYPFDVKAFGNEVMPILAKCCGARGCHGAPAGNSDLIIWAQAKPGDCDFAKTFNSVVKKVDLTTPGNSRIIGAINGSTPAHPFSIGATSPDLAKLTSFVSTAAATFAADGGGVTAPVGPSPFNATTYLTTIQPMLERCTGAGCHSPSSNSGGFSIASAPAAGSKDLNDNFVAVTSRANLSNPPTSL